MTLHISYKPIFWIVSVKKAPFQKHKNNYKRLKSTKNQSKFDRKQPGINHNHARMDQETNSLLGLFVPVHEWWICLHQSGRQFDNFIVQFLFLLTLQESRKYIVCHFCRTPCFSYYLRQDVQLHYHSE